DTDGRRSVRNVRGHAPGLNAPPPHREGEAEAITTPPLLVVRPMEPVLGARLASELERVRREITADPSANFRAYLERLRWQHRLAARSHDLLARARGRVQLRGVRRRLGFRGSAPCRGSGRKRVPAEGILGVRDVGAREDREQRDERRPTPPRGQPPARQRSAPFSSAARTCSTTWSRGTSACVWRSSSFTWTTPRSSSASPSTRQIVEPRLLARRSKLLSEPPRASSSTITPLRRKSRASVRPSSIARSPTGAMK